MDALTIADVERAPQYRRRRKGSSWGFSPNIRHHVEREKPPPPPKPKPTLAAPVAPVAKAPPPIGHFIGDYAELVELCRTQSEKLNLTRHETDRLAGTPDGHAGHILSKSFSKLIGPAYLLPLLEVLGVRLIAVVDPDLVARTLAKRAPPQRSHVRRQLTGTHGD